MLESENREQTFVGGVEFFFLFLVPMQESWIQSLEIWALFQVHSLTNTFIFDILLKNILTLHFSSEK